MSALTQRKVSHQSETIAPDLASSAQQKVQKIIVEMQKQAESLEWRWVVVPEQQRGRRESTWRPPEWWRGPATPWELDRLSVCGRPKELAKSSRLVDLGDPSTSQI